MSVLVAELSPRGIRDQRHLMRTILVVDDYGDAVGYTRRCYGCLEWKPLRVDYYTHNGRPDGQGFVRLCIDCARIADHKRVKTAAYRANRRRWRLARLATDPEYAQRERERERRNRAARRQRDIERERELGRRRSLTHKARIKADPERHAAFLEQARIDYRLRAEREGRTVRRTMKSAVSAWKPVTNGGGDRNLPAAPLRAWLHAVLRAIPDDKGLLGLARRLDIHERALRRVRDGEFDAVTLTFADRALTRHGRPVVIRLRDLEPLAPSLIARAQAGPGNGTRLLRYLDDAERLAAIADTAILRIEDLYPELDG